MTDWLAFGRQVAGDLDAVLAEHPTRLEREPVVGAGEGGDDTTAIDAAAERAAVARLEELAAGGVDFTLVSEELGERSFGAATPRLVLDPIDGSMNAKRGMPFFSVSLAVADGPAMADVFFGYRVRLRHARGMGGPSRRGRVSRRRAALGPGPEGDVEILSFEATRTDFVADQIGDMVGFAPPHAGHGLARAVALPPRGRTRGRGVLAQACAKRRHRRRATSRRRARPFHRPSRPAALRRRAARCEPSLTGCRSRDAGALCRALPATQRARLSRSRRFCAHGGPLLVGHRVPGRVAQGAVADEHVLAEDPLETGRKGFERRP